MSCCHYYDFTEGRETVFAVDVAAIRYGSGVLKELGHDVAELGLKKVALFTDKRVAQIEPFSEAITSLKQYNVDFIIFDEVQIEPTDKSFEQATVFATSVACDGFVSIGGGSVIDTCKAANLYSSYPAELLTYVNAPIGEGKPIPGLLKPHIACPTTAGTGSECTGIAVFDYLDKQVKTGIASRLLRPTRALIDPRCTETLPSMVVAASGFDVLSHALESYTALPYSARHYSDEPASRPMSQGANPYSDLGCRNALDLCGRYLVRAANDAADFEARHNMMFAATLAGIAFGNSGVHIPHGMSYSVAGLVKNYFPEGYPQHEAMCPHGISVIVNAPAAFKFTANACPERHIHGAALLGADVSDMTKGEEGDVLSHHLQKMMQLTKMPNGVSGVGYKNEDIAALTTGAYAQQRLLKNAPKQVSIENMTQIFTDAMTYW